MIGSVLGLEHKKERLKALDQIEQAHEQDSDVWPESYCYSLWELLAPRKSKGLEGSKDLKGKTLFDKGVMMEAPQKQVEKVGYNEVKYALGIFGDEGRKEHGYDTKYTLTEDVEVREGKNATNDGDGQDGCGASTDFSFAAEKEGLA